MNRTITLALASTIVIGGCATRPEKVEPAYVDPMQYQSYNCDQIATSMQNRSRRIADLHTRMEEQANDDAAAVGISAILFWPAAFLASGGNEQQVAEYRRLKGEYNALQEQGVLKECNIQVASPEERLRDKRDSQATEPEEPEGSDRGGTGRDHI